MTKEKFHLEYLLKTTSISILWDAVSTPAGLEKWFADKVTTVDKNVEFYWGKNEMRSAKITAIRTPLYIRFHWLDDEDERTYFQIKILMNELTNDYVLEITDFALSKEIDESKSLWNSQIAGLRRNCGF